MEVCRIDPGWLVFVDKMGTHTSLAPVYAYATNAIGASVLLDPKEPRQKLHAAYNEPSSRRDGPLDGRGRGDHRPSVRNLRGALAGPP